MNARRTILSLLLPLATLTGCATDPNPPEPTSDEEVEQVSQEIVGLALNPRAGVVRISIPGDPQVRTGLLVGPDLVLTSARFVPAGVNASAIQVTNGVNGAQVRSGWVVTLNPYMPVAIIQTTQPFASPGAVIIDARSAQGIVNAGARLECSAYRSANEFQTAAQAVIRTDGPREYLVGPNPNSTQRLDDWDAGAPCFDTNTGSWVGFALSSPGNNQTRVFVASEIAFFVRGMQRLAQVRRNTVGAAFMVQTTAPGGARMCLDIPWGWPYDGIGLNQIPCTGNLSQRWFLDTSHTGAPSLINAVTGTCVDVPGGSQQPGERLQAYACHDGPNQGWAGNGGGRLAPLSAPLNRATGLRTLCMSVRGGASGVTQPVEQATCVAGAAQQDWSFGYGF